MTIKEIHTKYLYALMQIYSKGEASKITEMIFEAMAKIKKHDIVLHGKNKIDTAVVATLDNGLEKLLQHYPVQYLIGKTWFYNLQFTVSKDVLIPRQETEELVQEAIAFLKENKSNKVIDIGTGSGCIPIALKKNIEDASVIAIDISEAALQIAQQNADANHALIKLKQIDFLDESNYTSFEKFDLIISNPPYIPAEEEKIMDKHVTQHEPHLALFVPQNDPLLFYKKIATFAENHLTNNGKIMLEVHEDLANETAAIFTSKNYAAIIKKDMQGKERMLIISHFQKQ
jgi:release factor glutamine methyltransferase